MLLSKWCMLSYKDAALMSQAGREQLLQKHMDITHYSAPEKCPTGNKRDIHSAFSSTKPENQGSQATRNNCSLPSPNV